MHPGNNRLMKFSTRNFIIEEILQNRDEFLKIVKKRNLEGYLFPETYYFEVNTSAEKVVNRMIEEFNKNFTPQMRKRANEMKKLDEKNYFHLIMYYL